MKVFRFLVHSNIFIAFGAVSLAMATRVQLGLKPRFDVSLSIIFFATIFDYNLHRFVTVYKNPEAKLSEKNIWSIDHWGILKMLLILSISGLIVSLLFAENRFLFALIPLGLLSFLYSVSLPGKGRNSLLFKQIPGIKTLLIALVWSAATVLLPLMQGENVFSQNQILIILAERFTFFFAIAIPFDIRDIKSDRVTGIKTIPIALGEIKALQISNLVLILFMAIASIHYWNNQTPQIIAFFLVTGTATIFVINSKKLQSISYYYHGILDGCILLFGILLCLSYFLL
ncbi:MAG: UbiA family prenyltransferase [Bacteroidota bacterium]